jgi:hypothetical protein
MDQIEFVEHAPRRLSGVSDVFPSTHRELAFGVRVAGAAPTIQVFLEHAPAPEGPWELVHRLTVPAGGPRRKTAVRCVVDGLRAYMRATWQPASADDFEGALMLGIRGEPVPEEPSA